MFNGFTQKTSDFLWELSFHNERTWFHEHKDEFEKYMNEPFRQNAKAVFELMSERFPDTGWQLHISRIYRDARRLYGRPPFNDHLWFTLWTDDIDKNGPAFWFELGKKDYSFGTGAWGSTPEFMAAYRKAIDANPAGFETMVKKLMSGGSYTILGEQYKKPKADRGEFLNQWYNRKYVCLECWEDFGGIVLSPDLPVILADAFTELMPLYSFFCDIYRTLENGRSELR